MSMDKHFITAMRNLLGADAVFTEPAECISYGYDNSRRQSQPDMVVFPTRTEQVQAIVQQCNQHHIPLLPRGRGTGTTGATVALQAGVVMSFERMNRIIKVDPDNRAMVVQPGVTNQQVQDAAGEHGFFWAPDPTSAAYCSVGGNLAYNSAGPRAVKYGTCRENTLGLQAITGAGELIHCGVYTTKGVVGYDLTRLIIGSEGTLAIITEATLKLLPKAEHKQTLQATYTTMDAAARAVSRIMAQSVTPCALEFMDENALNMVREYSRAELPTDAGAMLMIEVDGSASYLADAVDAVRQAAEVDGHIETRVADTEEKIKALWETRKALSPSLRKIAPKKINEDVVVPVSNMAALIRGLNALSEQFHIPIVNFGHAGNGNIHVNLLVNPDDPQQMANAAQCLDQVFDLVLSLNGTLSGEHGVGLEKRDYIYKELSANEIRLMHAIKRQFDPDNILNVGKTLPEIS
jgi:D-lactate dehydrogenase